MHKEQAALYGEGFRLGGTKKTADFAADQKDRRERMEDLKLVEKLKKGDTRALDKLMGKYTAYAAAIIKLVGGFAFGKEDVEELTADCFIELWKRSEEFEMQGDSLKPYLAAMARNKAKNKLESLKLAPIPLEEDFIADGCDLSGELEREELAEIIKECIMELDETDRKIFDLRYFYLLKTREIAEELNMNQKTVETRLMRGRDKLRVIMAWKGVMKDE
ncbi:MAG TPA: hypothetical protein DEQ02_01045 [Ruminococcaceae bacterium]|nr:hypothetical protein [Oscillospiraceae bacterium]